MANDNKSAPGSQGQGQGSGQTGKQNQGQGNDPAGKDVSRNSGNRPSEKPQYDADRPGYDVDVETEVPGGRKNASEPNQPGQGKPGMGWGSGSGSDRPDTDRSGSRPPSQRPDDERQTKKGP